MHYDNVDRLASSMLSDTNYNQNQWAHPCGAGACLAGRAVVELGLAENEILSNDGTIRVKKPTFDAAVAAFYEEMGSRPDGRPVSLLTPYGGDQLNSMAEQLTMLRRNHSDYVDDVRERAAEILGVSAGWLEKTKLFFPRPDEHWPFPYNEAWRSTITMTNPQQTVVQRSLAISYLLTLKEIEKEIEDRGITAEFEDRRSSLQEALEEHDAILDDDDISLPDSVRSTLDDKIDTLKEDLESLCDEENNGPRLIRERWLGTPEAFAA